jgi:hypothetical protein
MTPVTVALIALGALTGIAIIAIAMARAARWDDGLDETDTLPRMGEALR